jgi:hypothetical protein
MFISDYFFYRLISFSRMCKMANPGIFALSVLTMTVVFNIETIRRALGYKQILESPYILILFLSIFGGLYLIYIRFKRHLKIDERYKDENKTKKVTGFVILGLYVIATFVTLTYFYPNK